MSFPKSFSRVASFKTVDAFRDHCQTLGIDLSCDDRILTAPESPLAIPLRRDGFHIGNRFCIQPMEGWDGTANGKASEAVKRRWRRFGESGAKLIWGGEAVAVCHEGRANPFQLSAEPANKPSLSELRQIVVDAHRERFGSSDDLLIGLQLTHSGRFCRPNDNRKLEPKIVYHHPILDRKFGIAVDHPVLSDSEIEQLIDQFVAAATLACECGYQFVDIKHCHGYLGHELLSAARRGGKFGGSFENRTRFLRNIVSGIRTAAPCLSIGVRLSAFDLVPFCDDPTQRTSGRLGPGIPESYQDAVPYDCGFGVDATDPYRHHLDDAVKFLKLLESLRIKLVNISCGSPYYNPHIQRPALFPPSDGYLPPEDPLVGVARQIAATASLKKRFSRLIIVGSAYSYLQEYLPHVAQRVVGGGMADLVGIGRMVLSYPQLPADILEQGRLKHKLICRTFSDCTTAPRNGLPSGCYPLDEFYKRSDHATLLADAKRKGQATNSR